MKMLVISLLLLFAIGASATDLGVGVYQSFGSDLKWCPHAVKPISNAGTLVSIEVKYLSPCALGTTTYTCTNGNTCVDWQLATIRVASDSSYYWELNGNQVLFSKVWEP